MATRMEDSDMEIVRRILRVADQLEDDPYGTAEMLREHVDYIRWRSNRRAISPGINQRLWEGMRILVLGDGDLRHRLADAMSRLSPAGYSYCPEWLKKELARWDWDQRMAGRAWDGRSSAEEQVLMGMTAEEIVRLAEDYQRWEKRIGMPFLGEGERYEEVGM